MKISGKVNNPEATYGSILIFVSCALGAASMYMRPADAPYPPTTFLIKISLLFVTGILLQFKKKDFFIGRQTLIFLLLAVAAFYLEMLIKGIREIKTERAFIYIYFAIFFVMNLMIILRIARSIKAKPSVKQIVD